MKLLLVSNGLSDEKVLEIMASADESLIFFKKGESMEISIFDKIKGFEMSFIEYLSKQDILFSCGNILAKSEGEEYLSYLPEDILPSDICTKYGIRQEKLNKRASSKRSPRKKKEEEQEETEVKQIEKDEEAQAKEDWVDLCNAQDIITEEVKSDTADKGQEEQKTDESMDEAAGTEENFEKLDEVMNKNKKTEEISVSNITLLRTYVPNQFRSDEQVRRIGEIIRDHRTKEELVPVLEDEFPGTYDAVKEKLQMLWNLLAR